MRIAVDTGGTFTDCVFVRAGELRILKVLSTPENPARAISEAMAKIVSETEMSPGETIELTCGTTVGTNALLERRGGRVALVTTAGFEDVVEIGRQARPRLYDFFVQRPKALVPRERRFGLRERVSAEGCAIAAALACRIHANRAPREEERRGRGRRVFAFLLCQSHP